MTNSTRKDLIDAYQELDMLLGFYEDRNPDRAPECRRIIERVLPPRPRPTMAEVEWDDDKHYLAEAESEAYGLVIMLQKSKETGNILIIFRGELKDYLIWQKPNFLAPTGRRYALTEVQDND